MKISVGRWPPFKGQGQTLGLLRVIRCDSTVEPQGLRRPNLLALTALLLASLQDALYLRSDPCRPQVIENRSYTRFASAALPTVFFLDSSTCNDLSLGTRYASRSLESLPR